MATQQSGLVTRNVPVVTGGVSKRDPFVRDPSQCEELINQWPRYDEGLRRRPGSKFVAKLTGDGEVGDTEGGSKSIFMHSYNRDEQEQYLFLISDGQAAILNTKTLEVVDVDVAEDAEEYLVSENPITDFRSVTVGDYTFLLNKTIEVEATTSSEDEAAFQAALWVRMGGIPSLSYAFTIDGVSYTRWLTSHRYASDEWNTDRVAAVIKQLLPQGQALSTIYLSGQQQAGDVITITETISGKSMAVTLVSGIDRYMADDGTNITEHGADTYIVERLRAHLDGDLWELLDDGMVVNLYNTGIHFTHNTNMTFSVSTTSGVGATVTAENSGVLANTYVVELLDSTLVISRVDEADFTISSQDGFGSRALDITKGKTQRFTDLPLVSGEGFAVKVTGEGSVTADDFYVEYTSDGTADGQGVWVESRKRGEDIEFDATTMPHVFIRQSDGTFTFGPHTWKPRTVGDSESNPMPGFVGKKITDIFFFKDRLGVTAGENLIFTEVHKYDNFFRTTVRALLPSDRIDVSLADRKVAIIQHAVVHASDLILWSDNGQFLVAGSVPLTPTTVSAPPVSGFDGSPAVKPVSSGKVLHFLQDLGSTTKVYEYSADGASGETNRRDADDISKSLTTYLDGSPYALGVTKTANIVAVATMCVPNDLFVCSQEWEQGDESKSRKILSSWGRWRFGSDEDNAVINFECIDNKMFLIVERGEELVLEVIAMEPGINSPALDCTFRTAEEPLGLSVAYENDDEEDTTTWTLPIAIAEDEDYPVVVINETTGAVIVTTRPTDTTIAAEGDFSDVDVLIGIHYGGSWQLTKLFITDPQPNGTHVALTDSRLQIHKADLNYAQAQAFTVEVQPDLASRPSAEPRVTTMPLSSTPVSGTLSIPILLQNDKATITVKNTGHYPAAFQSFAWTGYLQTLAKRI